jgi:UDP-glucose 4-epimerase
MLRGRGDSAAARVGARGAQKGLALIGVFGANGFMGRHLLRKLAEERIPARAFSRRFDLNVDRGAPQIEFVEGDFAHPLERTAALDGIDVVVQLISTSSPGLRNDHVISDIQENVIPHVGFLEQCVRSKVRRYIFISSGGAVYGEQATPPTTEEAPVAPISSYGVTKVTIEQYIKMYGYLNEMDYSILRVSNPFGPGQKFKKGQGLIPFVLDRATRRLPIQIFGDGNSRRDYLYIDDLTNALYLSIVNEKECRAVINIGSGESKSINEVVDEIEANLDYSLKREYVQARATDVRMTMLNITRSRDILGWKPEISFTDGIRTTVSAFIRQ